MDDNGALQRQTNAADSARRRPRSITTTTPITLIEAITQALA